MTTGDAPWKLREPRVVVTANIPDNTDVDYADPPSSEARLNRGQLGEHRYQNISIPLSVVEWHDLARSLFSSRTVTKASEKLGSV